MEARKILHLLNVSLENIKTPELLTHLFAHDRLTMRASDPVSRCISWMPRPVLSDLRNLLV